jgi:hypothetical protein
VKCPSCATVFATSAEAFTASPIPTAAPAPPPADGGQGNERVQLEANRDFGFGHGEDDEAPPMPKLKSLAQNVREKHLKSAGIVLLIIGALMAVIHVVLFIRTPIEVAQEIDKQLAPLGGRNSFQVDKVKLKQIEQFALMFGYAVYAGAALIGVALVVCGLLIKKYPVVTSILGLALYVVFQLIFTMINPAFLIQGILFKIIIIIALINAIKAAVAYERERNAEAELRPEPGTI